MKEFLIKHKTTIIVVIIVAIVVWYFFLRKKKVDTTVTITTSNAGDKKEEIKTESNFGERPEIKKFIFNSDYRVFKPQTEIYITIPRNTIVEGYYASPKTIKFSYVPIKHGEYAFKYVIPPSGYSILIPFSNNNQSVR